MIKPILFNTDMVKAILEGRKTQTRRVVKVQPPDARDDWRLITLLASTCSQTNKKINQQRWARLDGIEILDDTDVYFKPKYEIGDILWVRETWQHIGVDINSKYVYRATDDEGFGLLKGFIWKPSLFMPKAACRLFLKVTNVSIEKLLDISEEDAINEGIEQIIDHQGDFCYQVIGENAVTKTAKSAFARLWNSINLKRGYGWDSNPWVYVYEFEITEKPEGWV